MTAAPARFTFDLDLGRARTHAGGIDTAAHAAALDAARAAAYAEGFAAGEASATARATERLAVSSEALVTHALTLIAGLDATRLGLETEALDLATGIARKLAAGLMAREPAAELDALLGECLASLEGVPHLVIRCAVELADEVRARATDRIAASGFAGRLIVIGDPELAPGDGRIEWADGGLVRDQAAIAAAIDNRIATYLAARTAPATPAHEFEEPRP